MAKEQVIRSELPPPSAKSDNKSGQKEFSDEEFKRIAFWIERVAAFLLFLCLFPITYHILLPVMSICLLCISNYLYIETYMIPQKQVIRAETPQSVVGSDNKSEGGGKLIKGEGFAFWIERVASFLVVFGWLASSICQHILHLAAWLFCISSIFYTFLDEKKDKLNKNVTEPKKEVKPKHERNNIVDVKNVEKQKAKLDDSAKEAKEAVKAKDGRISEIDEEKADKQKAKLDDIVKETKGEVKAKVERINEIDKENTEQEIGKLGFGLKESKEEEAKDESMNTEEETTGQHKARLEVSLKELKEEVRSFGKEFQSVEAKYLAKIKKRVDKLQKSFDKFHEWEEERSQLMYELGAARASVGIYRELLHDLHYHQQP